MKSVYEMKVKSKILSDKNWEINGLWCRKCAQFVVDCASQFSWLLHQHLVILSASQLLTCSLITVCLVKLELGAGLGDSHEGGGEPGPDNRLLLRRGTMYPVLTSANLSYSVVTGSKCVLECQVTKIIREKRFSLWVFRGKTN